MQVRQRGPVHFIGIGGVGMSGIASVMLEMGCTVSGSDIRATHRTARLARSGATIHIAASKTPGFRAGKGFKDAIQ